MSASPNVRADPSAGPLPSGTVTFVFTEIEDAAARWEQHPVAMREALGRHDTVLRDAVAAHNGSVFKIIGGAFCVAFARPQDAVAAMVAAQRALAGQDFGAAGGLDVRAAIHTGTADERDGDYFGPTVNRVARLLATANGGQIVVSRPTAELARDAIGPHVALRDLGRHRLEDVSQPEHVYEVLAPGLRSEFAPLRSIDARPNNLPPPVTSFVGREAEIATIEALLAQHRLVTLVGSGGVGKTRTAVQVAARQLGGPVPAAWLIELAPLMDAAFVPSTIAKTLNVALESNCEPVAAVVRALAPVNALLLLDNCEHLVGGIASLAAAILRGCPSIKILATSRQALAIGGEQTYRLPSLAVPSDGDAVTLDTATAYASLALFIERARAADHRFTADDANVGAIADIVRRLDGIPLAIELAAARVALLSPHNLKRRLDERFRVLTGGSRDALPRQQTLRALIDWSHDLLDERERALFRRSSIFVNGFTLDGALAIGRADGLDDVDVIDVLDSLVDKSLVLAEPDGTTRRYRLLESTRAYALERLAAARESERCALLHLHYLRDRFSAAFEDGERTDRPDRLLACCAAEIADVRAALRFALGADPRAGAALLAAMSTGWKNLGVDAEGLAQCEAFAAALGDKDDALVARLWDVVRNLCVGTARMSRAYEAASTAVAHARRATDARALAAALTGYAYVAGSLGDEAHAEAAASEAEAIVDVSKRQRRLFLNTRALLSRRRGDLAAAARAYEALHRTHRENGNDVNARKELVNIAEIEHIRGRTLAAIAVATNALPQFRAAPDRSSLISLLANLAGYLVATDDVEPACAMAREAIRELGDGDLDSPLGAFAIEHLALGLALRGDLPRAARLAGFAASAVSRHGAQREFTERASHERLVALLSDRLEPAQLGRRGAAGATLSTRAASALALELP